MVKSLVRSHKTPIMTATTVKTRTREETKGRPIKVVYLIDSLTSGGAQRQFVELIKGLDKSQVDPIVVIYHDIQHFREDLDKTNIPVHLLQKKGKIGIGFFLRLQIFLRQHSPVLIHSFLNTPNFYARLSKVFKSVGLVVTSERSMVTTRSFFCYVLERTMWKISDHIIANAEAIKDSLTGNIGIPKEKVTVVQNGINTKMFCHDHNKVVPTSHHVERLTIGYVGRIVPIKGIEYLLEACHLYKIKTNAQISIKLYGENQNQEYLAKLLHLIEQRSLSDNVQFCGVGKDMSCVLASIDLLVLPSLSEGFSNVIIESMAAGKPVIATCVGDARMVITEGTNGFLVPPGDPVKLAEKIVEVSSMDRAALEEILHNAKDCVEKDYSITSLVGKTLEVYKSIGAIR